MEQFDLYSYNAYRDQHAHVYSSNGNLFTFYFSDIYYRNCIFSSVQAHVLCWLLRLMVNILGKSKCFSF